MADISFSDQLRKAIKDWIKETGESKYQIAIEAKINHTTLNRFTSKEDPKPVTTDTVDKLVKYLGLVLTKQSKSK